MKKRSLGIVGGMGSQASAWLMDRITRISKADNDQDYLDIILHSNSKIPDRTKAIMHGQESPITELKRSIQLFNLQGVDVAVMACMTAYYYYPPLAEMFNGKFIHPAEIVLEELQQDARCAGKHAIGLIGSTGMLNSGIFRQRLQPLGYEVLTLNPADQEQYFMFPIYRKEGFKAGVFSRENRELFMKQVEILAANGAEVIVGACSEIPLVIEKYGITAADMPVPFIDAFDLLAHKVVDYCYSRNQKTIDHGVHA